ncbi:MAG: ACT domain-containing protein [Candidatus Methanomethylicia archaeon]|nr:ACT domain-containing protein [Candidatus Methanomethylicia archaeon]
MAHNEEIIRIDSKGRVTIPSRIRDELGMQEGSYVVVRSNKDEKCAIVGLFAGAKARLVEMTLKIPDRPGALARAARALSELNIDLMMSSSRTLKKGDVAEWVVIADVSEVKLSIQEIKEKILSNRSAVSVEIKEMPV